MRELRILVAFSLHTKFELPKFIRFEEMTGGGTPAKTASATTVSPRAIDSKSMALVSSI